ncbi:Uncharacterised protein [Mycobacteroides abscessus subsp. abscessus]|nr:Uncharacterised protein [Mycobacteroides abscessus subsp. abscessus]
MSCSCAKYPSLRPCPGSNSPASAVSTPASSLSSVVLPAPLSPKTTTREPRSMARSTPVKISSDP